MKKLFINLILAAYIVCILQSCTENKEGKRPFEHGIVIGIDGLAADGLQRAKTPVLDNLIANGAVKYDVRAVLPTVSMPNWAAMMCGAGPEASGITSNKWEPTGQWMQPIVKNKAGLFPTIFNIIREQFPEAEQGAIYHWNGIGEPIQPEVVNCSIHCPSPEETTRQVCEYITTKNPNFLFIQLDHVDGAGHGFGYKSDEYLQAVAKADTLVGQIIESIRQAGIEKNTLVLVVSDHGGFLKGHGGESTDEANVPIIFYGHGVKKNYQIRQTVYMFDVAANVAFALNLKRPHAWTGRPTLAAFEGHEEPE
jgi:predicted AlkP superfamily pyrophosphatase or phosphodiesterase